MASITLKNVTKIYRSTEKERGGLFRNKKVSEKKRDVIAVKDFSMEIEDKEFVVLLGPSGCGKSTTLRMIAGLEEIDGGELYIDDVLVNDMESKDRDVAMVFQNYALYPHMSVFDNMAFAIRKRISDKKEVERKVREAAEILGITEYLNRKPRELSGGQRQRVAIGRAIVRNPKVMLMDEPLSNLDAKLRNQMRSELLKLRKRIDATFVYVTHDQTEAMTLGDRVVVMKDGEVMQIGKPDEIYSNPASVFVATFIGNPQMNIFPISAYRKGEGYSINLFGKELALGMEYSSVLSKRKESFIPLKLGIRPEYITLDKENGLFSGEVSIAEHTGNSVIVHMNVNGNEVVALEEERKRVDVDYAPDSTLNFSFSLSDVYLFDAESGRNILYGVDNE
ncbi:MAG: ABC transporter ATP-binding protein [Candidatus Ornithospirochaeta sp.]